MGKSGAQFFNHLLDSLHKLLLCVAFFDIQITNKCYLALMEGIGGQESVKNNVITSIVKTTLKGISYTFCVIHSGQVLNM